MQVPAVYDLYSLTDPSSEFEHGLFLVIFISP